MEQVDRAPETLIVTSDRMVIGMEPHKRSAGIEVMASDETIVGAARI